MIDASLIKRLEKYGGKVVTEDAVIAAAFDAGWSTALDEAILIAETAEHHCKTLACAIKELREFRVKSSP
jgi:hypothetical protein